MYTIVKCNGNNYSINALKDKEYKNISFGSHPPTASRVMNVGPEWEGDHSWLDIQYTKIMFKYNTCCWWGPSS